MKVLKILLVLITITSNIKSYAQYEGGNGTSTSPYQIKTANQLVYLSNTSSDWNKHFKLIADIDMIGQTFTPIGNRANSFSGSFFGEYHTISNLTITAPSDKLDGTGMFGVANGSISYLGIINVFGNYTGSSFSNWTRVGTFVGILEGGGSITNCYSQGGSLTVSGGWTGGIVGVLFSGTTRTVEDCYSTTTISGSYGCGGIVGLTRGANTINRVAYYGTISGGNAIVSIQNDPANAQKNGIPPTNSYYATATGATDAEATGLNNSQLLNEGSYSTFNFSETWQIDNTQGYAVLSETIPEKPFFDKIRTERIASNQSVEWINFSPGTSGYCEEFWCHPTDGNTIFSGADMHASFGSWDNGQSWQTLKDYDGKGYDMRRVIDINFSLQDPDYGMAFANNQTGIHSATGEVYETKDRGRTWSRIFVAGKCHSKMAVHPTNDNIWLLGAGDFWNVKANHRTAANPGGVKQTRSDYGHIWKTTNKGASWTKVAINISADLDVGRIVFDKSNPNNIIIATSLGMYRSTDLGETWSPSATGLPNNYPRDLTSYYDANSNEFILYAIDQTFYSPSGTSIDSNGGIFKSTDGGVTWESITGNLAINMQSITDASTRDNYHRTVANWLGISRNNSTSTYTTYPTSALPSFNRIVVNPNNKNEVYVMQNKRHTFSFGPGDVWKTVDGGSTWKAVSRYGTYWINETDKSYWQSRNNPTEPNATFSHVQEYVDSQPERSRGARMFAINTNGDLYAGFGQQLFRSTDGGTSWGQIDDDETSPGSNIWIGRGNNNLPGRQILTETGIPGRKLLCSGEHGLWQTRNDISNLPNPEAVPVQQIEGQVHPNGAHSISTVAVHPNDPNTIYFLSWRQSHRGNLRRTQDGGNTWENISTPIAASNNLWEPLANQNSLLIDPNTPNNMYFCTTRGPVAEVNGTINESILTTGGFGVYKSSDAGFNWSLSNTGLPANGSVRRLTMDPTNPNILYASLNQRSSTNQSGGLYKSTDGALNWSQVSIPSEITSVNNFFIDKNTGFMFISAGTRNGGLNAGGVWKSENNGTSWTRIFEAPYVWQTEVSPVNSNIIIVSVPAQVPNMQDAFKNPGAYISVDAGATWTKINKGLAHPDRIVDIKPDPIDPTILWSAGWGSGWYKAIINLASLSIEENKQQLLNKKTIKIYPNPIKNTFKIGNISGFAKYKIWNIQGKQIQQGITSNNKTINVTRLTAGIYIIQISSQNKTVTRKIIIN
ncbi:hypothetical protein GCM10022291_13830 [Postechiella marina]|uniref:Secretion system C-terminal sorting domain-containing protein n=1 Tax=Postechiella marina TaxID=943941 RepID=A0ABP8C687_9FLAO